MFTASAATARNGYEEVNTIDSRVSRFECRPGEVIVKFRTTSNQTPLRLSDGKVTSTTKSLDNLLSKYKAVESSQPMPLSGSAVSTRKARAFNGREVADNNLSGLYTIRFDLQADQNVYAVVEELRALPEVEYAEPNYIMHSLATGDAFYSDPMYNQQWGIPAIGLDKLWPLKSLTSKRPVIAIIDTGVDTEHPDLKDNIWTNSAEADGAEGDDDDHNGYADDLHGWDFVNNTARMRDNNGHGTHCAGIAAASGNNGIGIVGANPEALIMPLAVLQSNGTGDIATIIKALDYAAANGADVISMSFGSYADSQALRDALGKAYQKSVLVAAAGNDQKCIYPHNCPVNKVKGATMFPAGYNFVLGVESSCDDKGTLSGFSNFDDDGPVFTTFGEKDLFNYELRAPGSSIMSTFPGGQYRSLNGTSMACPLVAGAISRLLSVKEYSGKEELFGDLIHTMNGNVNVFNAYNLTDADRKPTLSLVTYRLDDEKMGDADGRPDAGEEIRVYPTFRNTWGNARNVTYSLELSETEDPEIAELVQYGEDVHVINNISSYATVEAQNPFIIKINPTCADGRIISMVLRAKCDNMAEELVQPIELTVENGVELSGIITENMTLTPDKHYIVTGRLAVAKEATLTIKPGTTLNFKEGSTLKVDGPLIAQGKPDSLIRFTSAPLSQGIQYAFSFKPEHTLSYCIFDNMKFTSSTHWGFGEETLTNCIIRDIQSTALFDHTRIEKCVVYNNGRSWGSAVLFSYGVNASNTNINGNKDSQEQTRDDVILENCNTFNNYYYDTYKQILFSDIFYSGEIKKVTTTNYLGSTNHDILRKTVWDVNNPNSNSWAELDLNSVADRPWAEAHGIVWKVVVDGYDAQDEYELMPPLGVGKHKFEVYFNRRMNQAKAPFVAMGVRAPYTQTAIGEEGSWRTETFTREGYEGVDSVDIYTAYLTIQGKDNFDGINTIYVADAEDNEFFPIPIEDVRYRVNVQSAGSMSDGFRAEPGLGKVTLTWENPEANFDDMLGYNMYRSMVINDSTLSEPVRINEALLTEETLTDYDVVPGHRYCYYYKVMRTDMQENAASKVVAATPLTAAKGDANGSLDVDVTDVVTEISYMTGGNPQPFIFEAADVNSDSEVDILDVVGTVNIINKPEAEAAPAMRNEASATYTVENGVLYLDSQVELAGVQFTMLAPEGSVFTPMEGVRGMETTIARIGEEKYRFLAFSLSGRTVPAGRQPILRIGDAQLAEVILSDVNGHKVVAMQGNTGGVSVIAGAQMNVVTPNPFTGHIDVPVAIAAEGNHEVSLTMTAADGSVKLRNDFCLGYGEHVLRLNTSTLGSGFYLLTLGMNGRNIQTVKVVK